MNLTVVQSTSNASQKPTRMKVIDRIEFELLEIDSISEASLYHLRNNIAAVAENSTDLLVE